jgi:hypothetical protein
MKWIRLYTAVAERFDSKQLSLNQALSEPNSLRQPTAQIKSTKLGGRCALKLKMGKEQKRAT